MSELRQRHQQRVNDQVRTAVERWRRGFEYSVSRKKGKSSPEEALEIDVDERLAEHPVPIVGDTEHVIDRFAEFESVCGYDDLVVFVDVDSAGLSYEERREQLRAFERDVLPYFRERSETTG